MKRNFLLVSAMLILSISSFSQTNNSKSEDKDRSKLEDFSSKAGSLLKKEFITIGKIKALDLQVMENTDLMNNVKVKGLRFEYESFSSLGTSTKLAFIDADEVEGLLKSLNYIKDNILNTTPENYQEIFFKTRGGFEAGCFNDTRKKKWSIYFKLEKYDSRSSVFFESDDLSKIIELINQGKQKLS